MDVMKDAFGMCTQAVTECAGWLTKIFDAIGAKPYYLAIIFIVLACGFLLANFRVAMYVGSDFAGKHTITINPSHRVPRTRSDKASGYLGPGNDMRWR